MKAHFIGGPKDGHAEDFDGPPKPMVEFSVPRHGPAREASGEDAIGYIFDGPRDDGSVAYIWPSLKGRL